jgi:hypothetical protein
MHKKLTWLLRQPAVETEPEESAVSSLKFNVWYKVRVVWLSATNGLLSFNQFGNDQRRGRRVAHCLLDSPYGDATSNAGVVTDSSPLSWSPSILLASCNLTSNQDQTTRTEVLGVGPLLVSLTAFDTSAENDLFKS